MDDEGRTEKSISVALEMIVSETTNILGMLGEAIMTVWRMATVIIGWGI